MSLESLDGRTAAAQCVRELIAALEADKGGADNMTTAERQVAMTAALTTAMVRDLGARWSRGEPVDLALFPTLSNSERLAYEAIRGFEYRSKDVTPSLAEIAARIEAEEQAAAQ